MKLPSSFSVFLLLIAGLVTGHSQVLIDTTDWSYQQNFNSLPGTNETDPVATWTNNSTLTGWYGFGHYLAATDRMVASIGTQIDIVYYDGNKVDTLQNIGSGSDRALGLWATGTAGNNYIVFSMQNTSETTIDKMRLSYDALKVDGAATPEGKPAIMLSYQISSTPFNISGSWTSIPEAEYNPGAGANTTPFSLILTNLNLGDGQYLSFRFNQNATSVPAGIDNFKVQVIPEPHTALLITLGLMILVLCRNARGRSTLRTMKLPSLFPALLLLIAGPATGHSQVLINTTDWSYQQNFDSLPGTNDDPLATWTNGSTLLGWYGYGHNMAEKTEIFASDGKNANIAYPGGGNTVTAVQSIGNGSGRALGLWATSISGDQQYLFSLKNTSGSKIDHHEPQLRRFKSR